MSSPAPPLIPREGQGEKGILDRPYHEQSLGTRISLPLGDGVGSLNYFSSDCIGSHVGKAHS